MHRTRGVSSLKALEPGKKPVQQSSSSSHKSGHEIQIIEIKEGREKILSEKAPEHSVEPSFDIVQLTQEELVSLSALEGVPQPLKKPGISDQQGHPQSQEKTASFLPLPFKKPKREPRGAALGEKHDAAEAASVPRPNVKPRRQIVRASPLSLTEKKNASGDEVRGHPVDGPVVSRDAVALEPVKSEEPEDSLFWQEEEAPQAVPKEREKDQRAQANSPLTPPPTGSTLFSWPLKGKILKGFTKAGAHGRNDGLNIEGVSGDSVRAARQGQVVYVGNELHGFGHLILIKHDDEWMSAYAHLGEVKVKRGDMVRRAQVIATVGSSGSVSHPQLHFEVRRRSQPVDPKRFLE